MFKLRFIVMFIVTVLFSLPGLPEAYASENDRISELYKARQAGVEMGGGVYRITGEVLETKEKRLVLKTGGNGQPQSFHLADDTLIVPQRIAVGDSITLDYHPTDGDNIVKAILLNEPISEGALEAVAGEKKDKSVPTTRISNNIIALLGVLAVAALLAMFVLRRRRA